MSINVITQQAANHATDNVMAMGTHPQLLLVSLSFWDLHTYTNPILQE